MSLSKRDLSFLFDFLGNCFGNAGSQWVKGSLFWERHRNNQGGKSFVVVSSVPSLSKRRQHVLLLRMVSSPVPLPQGVFWEHQQPCCCRALEKQKGLALVCQAGVCSCVHTDLQQSYEESQQHCGSGGLLSQWSSGKITAFCRRLTLAAQTKDGVWD